MKVVIDANILLSILISSRGSKQDLLFSGEIETICPEILMFEIGKHWKEICCKSGLSEEDMVSSFSLVRSRVNVVPLDKYCAKLPEAKKICPHLKDVEYFALALVFNCSIWSEDNPIKQQSKVEVLNTKNLLKKINLD